MEDFRGGVLFRAVWGVFQPAEGLNSLKEIKSAATALSWFIQGDEALTDELCHGTLEEIAEGLEVAFSLIGVGNFIKLSGLAKNVATLTAKQKS